VIKIVLLPFDHYCHGPATQPRIRRSSFLSPRPVDVVHYISAT